MKESRILRFGHDSGKIDEGTQELYSQGFRLVTSGRIRTNFDRNETLLLFFERETPELPNESESAKQAVANDLLG